MSKKMSKMSKESIWAFYVVMTLIMAIVGYYLGEYIGVAVGVSIGVVLSIILWFSWGKQNSQ
jgi:hypothetical protein